MIDPGSRIHIVGAGGSGMSALGKLLAQMGHSVTGSDLRWGAALHELQDLGLEVWSGSRPERIREVDLVVASSAIPESDQELQAASMASVPVWDRPRLLQALTAQIHTIGATGTHGKTSSTALLIRGLQAAGERPSFIVGGRLNDLRTNGALDDRELLVLEVDEAFGTFLNLDLAALMVTNVEPDHLDFYETFDQLQDAFASVVRRVAGPVVIGADDPGGRHLARRTDRPTYGTHDGADWQVTDVTEGELGVGFTLTSPAGNSWAVQVGKPGLHMARNAAGALALLSETGHDVAAAAEGLAEFSGVHRRYEMRGRIGGVTLVDDYAHHPTEVAATLEAAGHGSWRRVWAVFQPHRYSRTAELHREFGGAFAAADEVVITDVYPAGETPVPGVTGELIAEAVEARTESPVTYVAHRADLAPFLAERVRAGDLVLSLGAGDITTLPDELAALIAS